MRDELQANSACRAQSYSGRVLFTVTSLSNAARREEHLDIPMLIGRTDGRETTQVEKREWATRVRRREWRTVSHVTINLTCVLRNAPHTRRTQAAWGES